MIPVSSPEAVLIQQKLEILKQFKRLPPVIKFLTSYRAKSDMERSWSVDGIQFGEEWEKTKKQTLTQFFVTRKWWGKHYFVRWGRLND
jgi:hypothetical protein